MNTLKKLQRCECHNSTSIIEIRDPGDASSASTASSKIMLSSRLVGISS